MSRLKTAIVSVSTVLVALLLVGAMLGKNASDDGAYRQLAVYTEVLSRLHAVLRPATYFEIGTLAGKTITTVEGLSQNGALSPLQQAFLHEQAGQCGYCLSGILISASALLAKNPKPSRAEIAEALDRNLCRCGMHNRVIRAIQRAGEVMAGAPR